MTIWIVIYVLIGFTLGAFFAFGFAHFEGSPPVAAVGIWVLFTTAWAVVLVLWMLAVVVGAVCAPEKAP